MYQKVLNHQEYIAKEYVKLPLFSFEYQFLISNDEHAARNLIGYFANMKKELKTDDESDTPDFFSSDDKKNGL